MAASAPKKRKRRSDFGKPKTAEHREAIRRAALEREGRKRMARLQEQKELLGLS